MYPFVCTTYDDTLGRGVIRLACYTGDSWPHPPFNQKFQKHGKMGKFIFNVYCLFWTSLDSAHAF